MLKKIALVLAVGYTIALATVSLITLNNLPDTGISFADKIFHFLAYALLTIFWFAAFSITFNWKKKRAMLIAVCSSILFGILIEVLQDTLTESRALDIYDILANSLGALLASIILFFKKSLHVKNV
ncbi:VanZ family protein [uncultured Algibacter sp.]|uniref:VanZ family protein n=1 Tax=uncultured Algibacter sp. TaxID=298659 RepID=UPI00261DAB98|nr:VanZ family protein [uncultured Algibacter sp.]